MKYKEYGRSPNYGRIFAYDKNGHTVQELDILGTVVQDLSGNDYTIGQLLGKIRTQEALINSMIKQQEKDLARIECAEKMLKQQELKIQKLTDSVLIIAAKLDADKI